MGIVKINLYKVVAERKLDAKGGQIRINNNVSIKDIEDLQFNIPGSSGLKFTFTFNCRYYSYIIRNSYVYSNLVRNNLKYALKIQKIKI